MKMYRTIGVLMATLLLAGSGIFLALQPATVSEAMGRNVIPTPTPADTPKTIAPPVQSEGRAVSSSLPTRESGLDAKFKTMGPPLIPPDSPNYYTPLPAGVTQVTAVGPVAYLAEPPAAVSQSIGVHLSVASPSTDAIAFAIRSSVRYLGGGHTILVTTAQFSPAAQEAYVQGRIQLGTEAFRLADGMPAWFIEQEGLPTPNWVIMPRDDYFITLASDLPAAEVKTLASKVVFQK